MSRSKSSKGKPAKQGRKAPPKDGALEDAALDEVAGGAGTSVAEAAEMASETQSNLQAAYQTYQQGVQLLSNMSKSMHDTAKAIIKNTKA